jgi:hypothetical protein
MTSLTSLTDNFLHCGETPLWFPTDISGANALNKCTSCTVRLSANFAGPGKLTATIDGFLVDENTQVFLSYNELSHTLRETRLVIPGAHRLPGEAEPAVAELLFFFQGDYANAQQYCICMPIFVGIGLGNDYFKTLSLNITPKRPSMASLFSEDKSFIQYTGAPLLGRSAKNKSPAAVCNPVSNRVRYLVYLGRIYITTNDLARLMNLKGRNHEGPVAPLAPTSSARIQALAMIVPNISIVSPRVGPDGTAPKAVSLNALKCRRIDVNKDIKGNTLYLDSDKGATTTLQKELDDAADTSRIMGVPKESSVKPGQIERVIAIVFGTVIAIVLCATIAYYTLKHTYPNYEHHLKTFPGLKVAETLRWPGFMRFFSS